MSSQLQFQTDFLSLFKAKEKENLALVEETSPSASAPLSDYLGQYMRTKGRFWGNLEWAINEYNSIDPNMDNWNGTLLPTEVWNVDQWPDPESFKTISGQSER